MILEPTWKRGVPELIMSDEVFAVTPGRHLHFELSKVRQCIGFHSFGAALQTPCLRERSIPEGKEAQCNDCRMKDISFAAKTGFGDTKQATELLNRDHAVYLALFSKDIIKIGVSIWERREIRTKEQGATACLFIARGNGTIARNLERKIHTNLGFTEWVRANTKLAALAQSVEAVEAESTLLEAYDRIKTRLGKTSLIAPEFMYHRPSFGLQDQLLTMPIHQITAIHPGAVFGGTVAGILGKILILEHDNKLYALDMYLLSGYSLERPCNDSLNASFASIETKSIEVDRQQSLLELL